MSEILTDTGLHLPAVYTEDEFFAAGQFLSKIERGTQWAIGDWYNAIPWGDKEAACERAGLNYKTAWNCALVSRAFQISLRKENLSFTHHARLAVDALTDQQRAELLGLAAENGWSASRLTKERDRMLGKPDKVQLLTFDAKVEQLIETLPKTATQKTKKAIEKVVSDLRHDFTANVEHAVNERMREQRERVHKLEREAQEERDRARALRMNLDGLMTEEEYRAIRACLHPDRAPEDRKAQFAKAFTIFTRLEESVNREMPSVLRKQRGWS